MRTTLEHQIRFARLHEMVAVTVAETYSLLQRLHRAAADYFKPGESHDDPKADRRRVMVEAMTAFHDYYIPKKLFIPRPTAEKIDTFDEKLFELARDFRWNVEQRGDSGQADLETWSRVRREMATIVLPMFAALERDFQSLLGMPTEEKVNATSA